MEKLKCGCQVNIDLNQHSYVRYPKCQKFLPDLFLVEPFPDVYDSPVRELIRKIYLLNKVAGNFNDIGGIQLVKGILQSIENSDICFFDLTGDIFNVAYEIGYSLATSFYPVGKKFIITGASDNLGDHVFSKIKMKIISILPQNPDTARSVCRYEIPEDLGDIDGASAIQNCDQNIRRYTTIELHPSDKKIPEQIKDLYPSNGYPTKRARKDILVLTDDRLNNLYNEVNKDGISKFQVMSPDIPFRGVDEMKYLIENIATMIVKEYDYLIVHLLGDDTDGMDNTKSHNFKAGVIAGMMKGLKINHQSNYYIAHKKNRWPNLRCSDINIYQRYRTHSDVADITNRIIRINILKKAL